MEDRAYRTTSTFTFVTPRSTMPIVSAAEYDKSTDRPGNIRTTVIDANRHGPSSLDVRDAQARAKWQCAVSGRQLIRIEFFAARCFRIVLVEARDTVGRRLRRRLGCRRDMLCGPCWCWMTIASGAPFRPVADNGRASASRKRRGRDSNRNYLRIDSTTAP